MNSQDFRSLQEAYMEVVMNEGFKRYDSDKFYKQMDKLRSSGKKDQATKNIKKINDQGTGAHHVNPRKEVENRERPESEKRSKTVEPKKSFGNRLTRSDKQGIRDSYDLYDIILSHLLDEGYADTQEAAEVIMVNMSEEWRESIMEISDKKVAAVGRRRQANVDKVMSSDEYISDKPGATQKLATKISQKSRFDYLNKKRVRRGG